MTKKIVWLVVSCLMVIALLLVSCAPAVTEGEEATPSEEEVVTEEEAPAPGEEETATEEEEAPVPGEEETVTEEEEAPPPGEEGTVTEEEEAPPPEEEETVPPEEPTPTEIHSLSISVNPPGSGFVSPSGGDFSSGTEVILAAQPNSGYTFVRWGGDASGNSPTATITMKSDKNVIAYFEKLAVTYNLTISASGQGATIPSPGTHAYDEGTQVTITASPASDWRFNHWSGDASGSSPTVVITMDSDKIIIAQFGAIAYISYDLLRVTISMEEKFEWDDEASASIEITNLSSIDGKAGLIIKLDDEMETSHELILGPDTKESISVALETDELGTHSLAVYHVDGHMLQSYEYTVVEDMYLLPKFVVTSLTETRNETTWEISGIVEQQEEALQGLLFESPGIVFCNNEGRKIAWLGSEGSYVEREYDARSFVLSLSADSVSGLGMWRPSYGDYLSFQTFKEVAHIYEVFVNTEEKLEYAEDHYKSQFRPDLSHLEGFPYIPIPETVRIPPQFSVSDLSIVRGEELTITGDLQQIEPAWQGLPEQDAARVHGIGIWFCKPDGSEIGGFAATIVPDVIMDNGTFSLELTIEEYYRYGAEVFGNMLFEDFVSQAVVCRILVNTQPIKVEENEYASQFHADFD